MVPPKQPQLCRKGRVELSRHFNLQLSSSLENDNPVAVSALVSQGNVLEAVEEKRNRSFSSLFTFHEISFQHLPSVLQHHSRHVGSPSPPSPLVLASPFPILASKDREGCTHSHPTVKTPSLIYLFGIYCSCVASQGNVYWMHFILFND